MAFTYSLVLFFTIIICFVASFDKRIQFYKFFIPFIKAASIVAIPFIIWDIWFTRNGVWWFDKQYTLGVSIAGLPIEEWLFFICIPFSCVFTYFCFDKFYNLDRFSILNKSIVALTVIICSSVALLNTDKIYTLVTGIITTLSMLFLYYIAKAKWIGKATLLYLILMLGFFPVNGVLTGTGIPSPIVNYNPGDFLGIRMLTIPIEDAVYGYAQFLWVLYFFIKFKK
jgi:lycopene cyclase domain-containing protein